MRATRRTGVPVLSSLAILIVGVTACMGEVTEPGAGGVEVAGRVAAGLDFELPADPPALRGGYQLIDDAMAGETSPLPGSAGALLAAPGTRIIYLNRNGGTYSSGAEDSRRNRSSIIRGSVTMPAYSRGQAAWSTFLACVKDEFSRFDVEVTDVDPGSVSHFEALISGRPQMAGFPANAAGVAPFTRNCSLIENAVVYIFEQVISNPTTLCEVAAQEIAHAFGLDHEFLCKDPMTYLSGCGHKTFQDQTVRCGEGSPRDCACVNPFTGTRATQNSVQLLFQRLGRATGDGGGGSPPTPPRDTTPPRVAVTSPRPGAVLPAGSTVTIQATASDNVGVSDVSLYWARNSLLVGCNNDTAGITCTRSGDSYVWSFTVGTGSRSFHVIARDAAGNTAQTPDQTLELR